jgi:hypothetical protein
MAVAIGAKRAAAPAAEVLTTSCRYRLRKKKIAKTPKLAANPATPAASSAGSRK